MTAGKHPTDEIDRTRRQLVRGAGVGAALLSIGSTVLEANAAPEAEAANRPAAVDDIRGALRHEGSIAADATRLPPPITRDHAVHHEIELEAREVEASLASGARFVFMT